MIDQWFQDAAEILMPVPGLMLRFFWIDLLALHVVVALKRRKVRKMLEEVARGRVR